MAARLPSDSRDASPLAEPLHFEFSGRTAPNRFLKAAMTEHLASWDPHDREASGIPSANLINVFRRWGEGGLGHIVTGNIMIDPAHIEAPGNAVIPLDAPFSGPRFDAFAALAREAKRHGSLISGQLSHPGRQTEARFTRNPISASAVPLPDTMGMTFATPHAATDAELADIVARFAHAALYLARAGFDGIQLHAAHGYLLAQFLASTTNTRTDEYGGSIANRARLLLEVAAAIRAAVPARFVLGVKLNSVEFQERGLTAAEAREVCRLLEAARFDYVELSGGTYQSLGFSHRRESTRRREAFFLEFARLIAPALKRTKTYLTGGFRTVGGMVGALDTVDGVGLARPLCQEFRFARDVLDGKVTGALAQLVDQDDFGMTSIVAGSQIRQVGKDQEPIDMGRRENVDAFVQDVGRWWQKMVSDGINHSGYVDIESVASVPYGTTPAV